jgi:hypothetical protein
MASLLAVLEGRGADAMTLMKDLQIEREPELVFYVARHFAMLNAADECIALLQRARTQGLTSSYTLMHDTVFDGIRNRAGFQREVDQARAREKEAARTFERAGGRAILS